MTELPLYLCHKKVRAAKITGITGPDGFSDGHAEIVLDTVDTSIKSPCIAYVVVPVDAAWLTRNPKLARGGYFVEYEDGYTSYSPAAAFENGYSLEESIISFTKKLTDEEISEMRKNMETYHGQIITTQKLPSRRW